MRRRLLKLLTALSLLLCVVVCVLWVRGRFVADSYATSRGEAASVDGALLFLWGEGRDVEDDPSRRGYLAHSLQDAMYAMALRFGVGGPSRGWDAAGFTYRSITTAGGRTRLFVVPCWAPAAAFALLPLGWTVRKVRTRLRPGPGHCQSCGYDLRASPGTCPECGAVAGDHVAASH